MAAVNRTNCEIEGATGSHKATNQHDVESMKTIFVLPVSRFEWQIPRGTTDAKIAWRGTAGGRLLMSPHVSISCAVYLSCLLVWWVFVELFCRLHQCTFYPGTLTEGSVATGRASLSRMLYRSAVR